MFSEIPRCVVEESWQDGRKAREAVHASSTDTAAEGKRDQSAQALRETDVSVAPARVCFYTEAELNQPTAARKKLPEEGVPFSEFLRRAHTNAQ